MSFNKTVVAATIAMGVAIGFSAWRVNSAKNQLQNIYEKVTGFMAESGLSPDSSSLNKGLLSSKGEYSFKLGGGNKTVTFRQAYQISYGLKYFFTGVMEGSSTYYIKENNGPEEIFATETFVVKSNNDISIVGTLAKPKEGIGEWQDVGYTFLITEDLSKTELKGTAKKISDLKNTFSIDGAYVKANSDLNNRFDQVAEFGADSVSAGAAYSAKALKWTITSKTDSSDTFSLGLKASMSDLIMAGKSEGISINLGASVSKLSKPDFEELGKALISARNDVLDEKEPSNASNILSKAKAVFAKGFEFEIGPLAYEKRNENDSVEFLFKAAVPAQANTDLSTLASTVDWSAKLNALGPSAEAIYMVLSPALREHKTSFFEWNVVSKNQNMTVNGKPITEEQLNALANFRNVVPALLMRKMINIPQKVNAAPNAQ